MHFNTEVVFPIRPSATRTARALAGFLALAAAPWAGAQSLATLSTGYPMTFSEVTAKACATDGSGDLGFVANANPGGTNAFVYMCYAGGTSASYENTTSGLTPAAVTFDSSGNIYVACILKTLKKGGGSTPTVEVFRMNNSLTPSSLVNYPSFSFSGYSMNPTAIVTDPSGNGNCYVTGTATASSTGDTNIFVVGFNSSGTAISPQAVFAGDNNDMASTISVDSFGHILVAGGLYSNYGDSANYIPAVIEWTTASNTSDWQQYFEGTASGPPPGIAGPPPMNSNLIHVGAFYNDVMWEFGSVVCPQIPTSDTDYWSSWTQNFTDSSTNSGIGYYYFNDTSGFIPTNGPWIPSGDDPYTGILVAGTAGAAGAYGYGGFIYMVPPHNTGNLDNYISNGMSDTPMVDQLTQTNANYLASLSSGQMASWGSGFVLAGALYSSTTAGLWYSMWEPTIVSQTYPVLYTAPYNPGGTGVATSVGVGANSDGSGFLCAYYTATNGNVNTIVLRYAAP